MTIYNPANDTYCNKSYRTMTQFIEEVPFDEILKAKFRRSQMTYKDAKDMLFMAMVKLALSKHGTVQAACEELGVCRNTIYAMLERHPSDLYKRFQKRFPNCVSNDMLIDMAEYPQYQLVKGDKAVLNKKTGFMMRGDKDKGVKLKNKDGKMVKKSIDKLYKEYYETENR